LAKLADLAADSLPIQVVTHSCGSSVGQGKFACHRPTFCHCAMKPNLPGPSIEDLGIQLEEVLSGHMPLLLHSNSVKALKVISSRVYAS